MAFIMFVRIPNGNGIVRHLCPSMYGKQVHVMHTRCEQYVSILYSVRAHFLLSSFLFPLPFSISWRVCVCVLPVCFSKRRAIFLLELK